MGCSASTTVATANESTPPTVTASLHSDHNHNHNYTFTTPIKVTLPSASPVHPRANLDACPASEAADEEETKDLPAHIFYGGQGEEAGGSLGQFVLESMRKHAEEGRVAQIDADSATEWTFADLLAHSIRAAQALEDMSLGPGDIVAFFSRNYHELYAGVLGTIMAGCTCAAMVPSNTLSELQHQIRLVKPRVLITEPALIPLAKAALANSPLPVILMSLLPSSDVPEDVQTFSGSQAESETDLASYKAVPVPNLRDHVALILFSSGTTGLPKGVMVSSNGLLQFAFNCRVLAKPGERFLATSPMSWISAIWILLCTLRMGVARIFIPVVTEAKLVHTIAATQVRRMLSAPPVLMAMAANPNIPDGFLSSVLSLCGGGPLTAEVYDTVEKRLGGKMLNAYGATEAGLLCLSEENNPRPGKIGPLLPNVTLKLVNIETEEDVTEPHVPGEVRIKSPTVMKGYVGNPVATAEAFDENGWLKTGDLATFDEEGYFNYVDRLKEMIKYRSYQVSPTEVESVLLSHPGVKDACVIGRPHDVDGDWPTGFIVRASGSDVTAAELQRLVAEQLSDPKTLRGGVFFLDAIPRTLTGKTMRKELRAKLDQYPIPEENEP